MDYISINHWEKHQHYKDRRPRWIKLEIDIIEEFDADGLPKKFYELPDTAKLTFICLLCLRANYNNKIPYKNEKWLLSRLGIGKLDLQPLVSAGYISVDTESVSEAYQDSIKKLESGTPETEKEREKELETERESCVSLSVSKFSLPEWFKEEDWQLFISHRKGLKCPISKGSFPAFIKKFDAWRSAGYDPHFVIDTLVERGWRSFKPEWVEDKNGNKKGNSAIRDGLARFLTEEDDDPRDKYRK